MIYSVAAVREISLPRGFCIKTQSSSVTGPGLANPVAPFADEIDIEEVVGFFFSLFFRLIDTDF